MANSSALFFAERSLQPLAFDWDRDAGFQITTAGSKAGAKFERQNVMQARLLFQMMF